MKMDGDRGGGVYCSKEHAGAFTEDILMQFIYLRHNEIQFTPMLSYASHGSLVQRGDGTGNEQANGPC